MEYLEVSSAVRGQNSTILNVYLQLLSIKHFTDFRFRG